ncbi:hypothetical protein C2W62_36545 [Candidatus Entotheonella serta]|nr:hypothetical protein C2W62_36545 [Candidatus Entotheonella serta]
MLLAMSLGSILVLGYISWKTSRDTISQTVFDHLTSVRTSKAHHIESYMHSLHEQMATLSENEMVIRAMVRFNKSFKHVEAELIPDQWEEEIGQYYRNEFLPRLAQNTLSDPSLEFYQPKNTAASYLQYWYIVKNEHPIGRASAFEK